MFLTSFVYLNHSATVGLGKLEKSLWGIVNLLDYAKWRGTRPLHLFPFCFHLGCATASSMFVVGNVLDFLSHN